MYLRLEPVLRELQPIGAKAIGFEDLGTGLHVGGVDLPYEVGGAQHQLVIALVDEHPSGVQHGAHRAIKHADLFRIKQAVELSGARPHAAHKLYRCSDQPSVVVMMKAVSMP